MTAIGFTLQPEERYLELLDGLIRAVPDYFEVAPETLWRPRGATLAAGFEPNGYHARFAALRAETGRPFVAHGVGLSLGTATPDPARRALWLETVARDHALFGFRWYTDHLGANVVAGRDHVLPLPLPYTPEAAAAVRRSLTQMHAVVGAVGVENAVFYAHLGDPLAEPAFLARCLAAPWAHLLLDLHNVYTTAVNAGFDPQEYLARLPLDKVIELHVSGGADSDPAWLRSHRVLRLDSHDTAVPEEVWTLLERTLPRCPNARGVTLERMEGTVEPADVPVLAEELARLSTIAKGSRAHALGAPALEGGVESAGTPDAIDSADIRGAAPPDAAEPAPSADGELAHVERLLAAVLDRPEPAEPLAQALAALDPAADLSPATRAALLAADPDGLALTALIVARLRFERLMQGSRLARSWFETDPRAFTAAFKRYHRAVPCDATAPAHEAARFDAWAAEETGGSSAAGPLHREPER